MDYLTSHSVMATLAHVAYALVALSFAVRDVLWLRLIAIVASGLLIASALGVQEPWLATVLWHSLFIAINATRVSMLIYGEKTARFTGEEKQLFETLFKELTRLEFLTLLKAGQWQTAPPGTVLATAGQELQEIMLIYHGVARVEVDGRQVALLRDGQLIGEISFAAGGPATATVIVVEPMRYLCWSKQTLRPLFHRNASIRFAFAGVVGADMSKKLKPS